MLFFICYFNNKKGEINQFKMSENLLPTLHKDRVNKLDLDSSGLSVFREVRKGYFRHHSKLLYIKGIGVGQTPIFCHLIFESVDGHHYESLRLKETNLPYISLFSKVSLSRFPNACPMMINFSSKKPVLSHTLGFLCTHFWFCADRWRRQRRASDFARSRFQNSA